MSKKEERFNAYKKTFDEMTLRKFQLARIFNSGQPATKSVQNTIHDKLSGRIGITKADMTSLQLLYVLQRILETKEISINDIEFQKNGRIKEAWLKHVITKLESD
ncbi:MAG: hypothetical protein ACRBEE_14880 [Arenicella sp.]